MLKGHSVRSLGVAFACCAAGCGGGAPLLHPAHVLPSGHVSAGAGVSGQFAFRNEPGAQGGPPEQHAFEDAIARASLSPGIAPWVGARAGLGGHFEAGLAYTGRSVRADARRAFGGETVAVSVGAAASAVFSDPQDRIDDGTAPMPMRGRLPPGGGDLRATGYGFDVPVLVGWRSTASVVQGWIGARGGVEQINGDLPLPPVGGERAPFASFSATRWYGGGLVGAAVGLWPVTVAVELDIAYQGVSGRASFPAEAGSPPQRDGSVSGLTVAPAGAIIGKF
jgi:hypothetical protein